MFLHNLLDVLVQIAKKMGLQKNSSTPLLEAGPTTSTVALRVVRGEEKETQCLGI
jgi:hypothetical protein